MNMILLKDLSSDRLDAVIMTQTTTADEIQKIIDEVKGNKIDWEVDDVYDVLPGDCQIYTADFSSETIYW